MSELGIEQRGHNAKDYKVWVSATLNFTDCVEELRYSKCREEVGLDRD